MRNRQPLQPELVFDPVSSPATGGRQSETAKLPAAAAVRDKYSRCLNSAVIRSETGEARPGRAAAGLPLRKEQAQRSEE